MDLEQGPLAAGQQKEAPMREKTVKEIMKSKVEALGRNDTLDIAHDVMSLDRLRHLPVVDEGRVVGVVSQRDLFQRSLGAALGYGEVSHKKLLHTILVKEVMSEPAITFRPRPRSKTRVGPCPERDRLPAGGPERLPGRHRLETDDARLIGTAVGSELVTTHR
jgi:hypothetical protein